MSTAPDPKAPEADAITPLTEEQRRTARAMAGLGVSRRQLARYLRMDETRLAALLGDELEQAEVEANSKVAKALFTMATQKNNVAAAIFWMKARSGWRERQEIDVTTQGVVSHVIRAPPRCASTEEWLERYKPREIA